MKFIKNILIASTLLSAAFFGGCATYSNAVVGMDAKVRAMDIPGASADALDKFNKSNGQQDQLVANLELCSLTRMYAMFGTKMTLPGTCYAALGHDHPYYLSASDPHSLFILGIRQLRDADTSFEYWDGQPDSSVSEQMRALLSNQTVTNYRGTFSDRIMAQTYLAVEYLQTGDFDKARVAFRRMHYYQTSAIERNARELRKADELSQSAMNGSNMPDSMQGTTYDVSAAKNDGRFQQQMDANYAGLRNLAPYGNFANPFSYWMEAVYRMHCAESRDDFENARKNLQYVYGITGQKDDLDLLKQAEKACDTRKAPTGVTYVIFEAGEAPILAEVKIEIPLNIVTQNNDMPYVAAAFPKLVLREDCEPSFFNVEADGITNPSHPICSMDRVIGEEFNRRFPVVMTKAMISAGVKGVLAYSVKKNTRDDLAGALVKFGTDVMTAALNQADTRSWHTLPKQISVVQIKTPASKVIKVSEPLGSSAPTGIALVDGPVNVVFVRQIRGGGPMIYSQFVLARK